MQKSEIVFGSKPHRQPERRQAMPLRRQKETEMKVIEYKVRPVTRYIVTRFEDEDNLGSSTSCGEFDQEEAALRVGFALARNDLDHYGFGGKAKVSFPDAPADWAYYPEKFTMRGLCGPRHLTKG